MKIQIWLAMAVCLAAVPGIALAAEPAGTSASATAGTGETWLRDLGSEDFATRAAAQKVLDQIPAARRAELEKLAAATHDPEVKARLMGRLAAIEEEMILKLPTINLELKAANLADAAAALSKAVNVPITGRDPNDGSGNPITLNMKDASYCQVLQEIAAQTPVSYSPSPYGVSLVGPNRVARPLPFPPPQACGPMLFFPQASLSGQMMNLGLTIIVDPRLQTIGPPTVSLVAKDDKGNNLAVIRSNRAGMGGSGPVGPEDYNRINYTPWSMAFAAPEDPKSRFTVKGEVQVRVVSHYARATINDLEKHLREPQDVGGCRISILEFGAANQQRSTNLRVSVMGAAPAEAGDAAAAQGSAAGAAVRIFLVDAAGRQVAQISTAGNVVKSIPQATIDEAKKPLRLEIAVPLQWKAIQVPVELKDLGVTPAVAGRGMPGGW